MYISTFLPNQDMGKHLNVGHLLVKRIEKNLFVVVVFIFINQLILVGYLFFK